MLATQNNLPPSLATCQHSSLNSNATCSNATWTTVAKVATQVFTLPPTQLSIFFIVFSQLGIIQIIYPLSSHLEVSSLKAVNMTVSFTEVSPDRSTMPGMQKTLNEYLLTK